MVRFVGGHRCGHPATVLPDVARVLRHRRPPRKADGMKQGGARCPKRGDLPSKTEALIKFV